MDNERLIYEIDKHLSRGIEVKVAPTIGIGVIKNEKVIYEGFKSDEKQHSIENAYFDIASLTKTFITTIFLKKIENESIKLEDKVKKYIEEFQSQEVTIKNLLLHNSGIAVDFHRGELNYREILNSLYNVKYTPNEKIEYSDGNYILLGEILKRDIGIEESIKNEILIPLEMNNTFYKPLEQKVDLQNIVKTEVRADRGEVRGVVHDNKCFKMGEVGGQAGLFSTLKDLEKFVLGILNNKILSKESIKMLKEIVVSDVEKKRTLGWVRKDEKGQMGFHEEDFSIFHTGFTGGEILINFDRELGIIILSNRVFPTRGNPKIFNFRKEINNLVYELNI